MQSTNISSATAGRAAIYIQKNWVCSEQTSFFKREIVARGAFFALSPAALITSALDVILGLGAAIAATTTLGTIESVNHFALIHLASSNGLVAVPCQTFLCGLNPNAKLAVLSPGFISANIFQRGLSIAQKYSKSDMFFVRHVVSRITYGLLAISCLVARTVDGIIGVPTTVLSIAALGTCRQLNAVAFKALAAPGIILDLALCALCIINPHAKF